MDYLFGLLSLLKLYKENEEISNKILYELFDNNCNKIYYYSNLVQLYNLIAYDTLQTNSYPPQSNSYPSPPLYNSPLPNSNLPPYNPYQQNSYPPQPNSYPPQSNPYPSPPLYKSPLPNFYPPPYILPPQNYLPPYYPPQQNSYPPQQNFYPPPLPTYIPPYSRFEYSKEKPLFTKEESKKIKSDYERNEVSIKKKNEYIKPTKKEYINKKQNSYQEVYTNNYNENNNKEEKQKNKEIDLLKNPLHLMSIVSLNSPETDLFKNTKIKKEVAIMSVLADKNLDICNNKVENGTPLILYRAHFGGSQTFIQQYNDDGTVSFINSRYAIDVSGGRVCNGTEIIIWEYNKDNYNQKFYLENHNSGIVSIHSALNRNFVIDVFASKADDWNKIQLYEFNGTNAQKFRIIPKKLASGK